MWNINEKKLNSLSRNYRQKLNNQRGGSLFNYEVDSRASIKFLIDSKKYNKFQTHYNFLKYKSKSQMSLKKNQSRENKNNEHFKNFVKKYQEIKYINADNKKPISHIKYLSDTKWNFQYNNLIKQTEKKLKNFYSPSSKLIKVEKKNLDTLNLSRNSGEGELNSKANSFISPRSIREFQELSENIKENQKSKKNLKNRINQYIKLNHDYKIKDDVRYNFYSKFQSVLESIGK